MPTHRILSFTLVLLFTSVLVINLAFPVSTEVSNLPTSNLDIDDITNIQSELTDLTPHEEIVITDNANFTNYGFSGSGTYSDPYMIQGLEIESSDTPCISVSSNVTAYFSIVRCRVSGTIA